MCEEHDVEWALVNIVQSQNGNCISQPGATLHLVFLGLPLVKKETTAKVKEDRTIALNC